MADSPPPHPPNISNAHPAAAGHLGDGVEVAGAPIDAVQPPTTTAEMTPFGGMFGDDASAAPTMAATPSTSILTTSNHHTVAARRQRDGTVAVGLQTKQFQPPRPHRVDVLSRFGVNDTSAAPTMATTPLFSTLLASNTHPVVAGHLGDGLGAAGSANEAVQPPITAAEVADSLPRPLPPSPSPLLQPVEQPTTSSVGRPIVTEPSGDGEMMARVELETTWPSDTIEEVSALPKNTSYYGRAETGDIPISNCNAEEGDGDDASEGDKMLPSDAKATTKNINEVSFSRFQPLH
jgi:hypothetical protein